MCGIAGVIDPSQPPETRVTAVNRMCAEMHHRGPDDSDVATRHEATIGSCRLAIFDPAHGHQPMASPDGRWSVVFNGAIYNHRGLRAELSRGDWSFRTHCDTEVLLAAIVRWGTGCLSRLRGMFAFAAWDDQERTLFLARDPYGIKPLYYRQDGGRLVFASELNALLASGLVEPSVDPDAVADYLGWFAVPAPRTIYRGVFSLRPGEFALWQESRLKIETGWTFQSIPQQPALASRREFVSELRVRLEDTIGAHMLADVPVGAFLSGGLDSAAVVALMTRVGGRPLRTFSIAFDDPEYSEASHAQATARHFGAEHHTHVLTGGELLCDLDRILAALDQPTGDGVNTYYASRAARAGGVKVALSGLGGDELFGGYSSFRDTPRLSRLLPWWRRMPAAMRRPLVSTLRRGDTRRRKLADVLEHASDIHEVGALQRRVFTEPGRDLLLSPDARRELASRTPFHPELARLAAELPDARPFETVSAWELRTYMADVLLRDSDVMSMRHSLELRVPFVDRPLIEWLWSQPGKSGHGAAKSALFDALADLLPSEMRNRKKRGFTLPFAVWMKQELRPFLEETFSAASLERSGLFATGQVQSLWRGYLGGSDAREWSRVWSLAVLVSFVNRRASLPVVQSRPVLLAETAPAPSHRNRTLLLTPEIFASEGGIPRILQTYLQALCELAGTERSVRLVTLNDTPAAVAAAVRGAGPLESWRACSRHKSRFIRETMKLARGCDTIVCGHIRQLPVAWLAKQLNPGLRYYLVAHGIEVWRPFGAAERVALRGAERILCVSDFTRRELLKRCPLPAAAVVVLPNALDPVFSPAPGRPLSECPPTILAVTRLTRTDAYKGVQHLIEAMPAVHAAVARARLRIVGRGDDAARLAKLSDDLGMRDIVEFAGYVDDARLAREMSECRLFALPSQKEGFGLVFLEAMAHGRPCLGARAGGVPEVISPETGVLVEYGDVPAIAAGIISALERSWDQQRILAHAAEFSFPSFKRRLAELLSA